MNHEISFHWQGKVAKSTNDSCSFLLNHNLLNKYLNSEESAFEVNSLHEFLETLAILGFQRSQLPQKEQKQLCYRYMNPNFDRNKPVRKDLYKIQVDSLLPALKNAKQMSEVFRSNVIHRILSRKSRNEIRITKLELTQKKLSFALQKQLDVIREEPVNVENILKLPDYVKNNEIAGYYGNAAIEDLQFGFRNFFPIYQEVPESEEDPEEEDPVALDQQETNEFEIIAEEVEQMEVEITTEVPAVADKIETTPKRKCMKRKHRSQILSAKETEEALTFLHKLTMEVNDSEE